MWRKIGIQVRRNNIYVMARQVYKSFWFWIDRTFVTYSIMGRKVYRKFRDTFDCWVYKKSYIYLVFCSTLINNDYSSPMIFKYHRGYLRSVKIWVWFDKLSGECLDFRDCLGYRLVICVEVKSYIYINSFYNF